MKNVEIAKALAVMAKLMPGGERIDEDSGDFLINALSDYDQEAVLKSLRRCFKELKFFPTVSEIIDRIDDGRPGTEEAWALAPKHDDSAAYLNDEIMGAWKSANDLLREGGDMIAARMTFKEVYERVVKENRSSGKVPKWFLSRASGRGSEVSNQAAMRDAIEKKRISIQSVLALLPDFTLSTTENKLIGISKPQVGNIQNLISSTMKKLGSGEISDAGNGNLTTKEGKA